MAVAGRMMCQALCVRKYEADIVEKNLRKGARYCMWRGNDTWLEKNESWGKVEARVAWRRRSGQGGAEKNRERVRVSHNIYIYIVKIKIKLR